VEPGSFETSRALVAAVREALRGSFGIVAPCTHQGVCGLLAPENERAWCHHFAPSPPEVYMDGRWARFAKTVGIDLRSLPLSYLVLDKRPAPALPAGAVRLIGRPRIQKAHALLAVCDATGVREKRLAKRLFPGEFRQCKREELDALQVLEYEGIEVTRMGKREQGTGNGEQGWSTA
jgi:ribosomal protein RSM22 (predicted rRNA methylase)